MRKETKTVDGKEVQYHTTGFHRGEILQGRCRADVDQAYDVEEEQGSLMSDGN